jgi:hypothetical protein
LGVWAAGCGEDTVWGAPPKDGCPLACMRVCVYVCGVVWAGSSSSVTNPGADTQTGR